MNYLAKPLVHPNDPQTEYPDWLIYSHGDISRPLALISDMDINRIAGQWAELHGYELKSKKTKGK